MKINLSNKEKKYFEQAISLSEAKPYIKKFQKKIFVIKYGGNALTNKYLADHFNRFQKYVRPHFIGQKYMFMFYTNQFVVSFVLLFLCTLCCHPREDEPPHHLKLPCSLGRSVARTHIFTGNGGR